MKITGSFWSLSSMTWTSFPMAQRWHSNFIEYNVYQRVLNFWTKGFKVVVHAVVTIVNLSLICICRIRRDGLRCLWWTSRLQESSLLIAPLRSTPRTSGAWNLVKTCCLILTTPRKPNPNERAKSCAHCTHTHNLVITHNYKLIPKIIQVSL